jgi:hypothetical protein
MTDEVKVQAITPRRERALENQVENLRQERDAARVALACAKAEAQALEAEVAGLKIALRITTGEA